MDLHIGLLVVALCVFSVRGSPIAYNDHEEFYISDDSEPITMGGRISNGFTALPNQFPYQVGLLSSARGLGYWCGGSIIDKEWILTAAHCLYQKHATRVYLNTIDRRTPGLLVNVTGDNMIVHEGYNPTYLYNDIALLKVPALEFSEGISPVRMPSRANSNDVLVGKEVIVSGWGKMKDTDRGATNILQYVNLKIMSNHLCSRYYSNLVVNDKEFCVFTPDTKSSCSGDSGGPAVIKENRMLVGLVSYGSSLGCQRGSPAGYTRVTSFLPWIEKHTGLRF